MRLIIAGGRNYVPTRADRTFLDSIKNVTEVVSGCASGADFAGELWATLNNIPIKRFPAEWSKYGRGAGPLRNLKMAKYADALVAFPGGRGTANMCIQAEQHDVKIIERPQTKETKQ